MPIPWFILPEHIRDAQKRRPDDPLYDPSTLYIPDSDWKNMTSGMQRYWEFKKDFYDKVLFYRLGQYFFVYFKDCEICLKHASELAMAGN